MGTATYSACISFDVTTALQDLWLETILPWIAENIRNVLAAEQVCVTEVSPTFDFPTNGISAVVAFHAMVVGPAGLLEYTHNIDRSLQTGKTLVPVWTPDTAFGKYVFQGPAREILRVQATARYQGRIPAKGLYAFPFVTDTIDGVSTSGQNTWVMVEDNENLTPIKRGLAALPEDICEYWMAVRTSTYERADGRFSRGAVSG